MTDTGSWITHAQGLESMFAVFGPLCSLDPLEREILEAWRPFMIMGSISARQTSMFAKCGWKADRLYHGNELSRLLDIFAELSFLYFSLDKAQTPFQATVMTKVSCLHQALRQAHAGLENLLTQLSGFKTSGRDFHVEPTNTEDFICAHQPYTFFSPSPVEWLPFCCALILLHVDLVRLLAKDIMPTDLDMDQDFQRNFDSVEKSAVEDICGSVEYLLKHNDGSIARFYIIFPMRVAKHFASQEQQNFLDEAFLRQHNVQGRGIWRAPLKRKWQRDTRKKSAFEAIFE